MSKEVYRSAEKSRNSSCSFADRVATLSIAEFKKRCPQSLKESYEQTVLASVLLEIPSEKQGQESVLKVVSLGVGTKFLANIYCDANGFVHDDYWRSVRDAHAEVLARRAFLHYIHQIMLEMLHDPTTVSSNELFLPLIIPDSTAQPKESIVWMNRFRIRPEIRFHFYTSSQPCGNACIKKFAKGSKPKYRDDLSPSEYPQDPHPRMLFSAKAQGQISCLVKKGSLVIPHPITDESETGSSTLAGKGDMSIEEDGASTVVMPPGTALCTSNQGYIKTCSDKIAIWNAVGIQGALLSHLLDLPIYLSTVTVGRKFSKVHAERALCCRLQDFGLDSALYTHHPVMLCSSVKFDEKCISVGNTSVAPVAGSLEGKVVVDAKTEARYDQASQKPLKRMRADIVNDQCDSLTPVVDSGDSQNSMQQPLISDAAVAVGASFLEKRCLFWSERMGDMASVLDGTTGFLDVQDCNGIQFTDRNAVESCISSVSLLKQYLTCSSHLQQLYCTKTEYKCNENLDQFTPSVYKYVKQFGVLPPLDNISPQRFANLNGVHSMKGGVDYSSAKDLLFRSRDSFLTNVDKFTPFCTSCGKIRQSYTTSASCECGCTL